MWIGSKLFMLIIRVWEHRSLVGSSYFRVPQETKALSDKERNKVYIYEPDCEEILETIYPLVIHSTMYRYLLENQTSEQASRILSMQMANDNAIKLLKNLQLEYNKLRQQNITAELMDIVGGSIE